MSEKPPGLIDVTEPPYSADPTGDTDATAAIQAALKAAAAAGTGVWLGERGNTFRLTGEPDASGDGPYSR